MKSFRSYYYIFLFILTALSFSQSDATISKAPLQSVSLALNWKAEPEFGGFYAADLEGFYKQQGLQVDIIQGGSGTPTVQMLSNGKIDFAIVSADEVILSQDRNPKNKVKALYAVYQKAPYIIMTHQERGFKTLKDVFTSEGVLSIQAGLPYYQFLVKKFGKPKAQVVPYLGGVSQFLSDGKFSQQGFLTTEPLLAEKSGAQVKNFLIADEGFNPYLVVIATTEKILKEQPDLVKKFIHASHLGWQSYLKNSDKVNRYIAQLNKSLTPDMLNFAAKMQRDLILTKDTDLGQMSDQRWNELAQQLKELGLIKSTPSASDLYAPQVLTP